jgi:hypothetical protein
MSAKPGTRSDSGRAVAPAWRLLPLFVLCLLSWLPQVEAQTGAFGLPRPSPPGDSLSAPDSLVFRPARTLKSLSEMEQAPFVGPPLPDSLRRADSLATASPSSSWWKDLWRHRAVWPSHGGFESPEPRPLPAMPALPDRPSEDLGDILRPLVAGPLFDQGQVGHRQELAQDGLQPRHLALRLDGLDLGSRLTGQSDLNLVAPGLTLARWSGAWQRLGSGAAGSLDFESLRARDDSVLTQVRWADGFLGFISVEGEFARPVLGGRALLASRQVFTHERMPGANYRGNLVYWNWDKPLGDQWLLRLDQRILRDVSEVLFVDGANRHLRQHLQRARLERGLGGQASLELDLWHREDQRDADLDRFREERESLRGAALTGHRLWAGGGARLRLAAERQRLWTTDWLESGTDVESRLTAGWTWPARAGRWALEPDLLLGRRTVVDHSHWSAGTRLGWTATAQPLWADLLTVEGSTPPTPAQLWQERLPQGSELFSNPWLRQAGLPLLPDSTLDGTRWSRQELRVGLVLWKGRLPLQLRAWRVELGNDLVESAVSDTSWSWTGHHHVQSGAQLFGTADLAPGWSLRVSQAWFRDSRNLLSREFPTWLLDGALRHERVLFGELRLVVHAGLHHEQGGVDSAGDALWQTPELWLQGEATRRRFTLWWALRNPFGWADNQRVEGLAQHGHEEWLGIRWGFQD